MRRSSERLKEFGLPLGREGEAIEVEEDRAKGLEARRGLAGRSTVAPRLGELVVDPSLVGEAANRFGRSEFGSF